MKKSALITGGTRGIGLGIAKEMAKKGFNLVLNGVRDESHVTETVSELKEMGVEVIYCQADISQPGDRANLVTAVLDSFGQLNVLINNAGVAPVDRKDLLVLSEESYDRVMDINLKGPFFLTQQLANHMVDCKKSDAEYSGCIINIGSVSASLVSIQRGEYCISKAGMGMMTQLFAVRMGEVGIPVYEVRPGVIETDMTAGVMDKYQKLRDQGLFVESRLGVPSDVGKVVAGLAVGTFPYSTGNVIAVDGGLTISRL